MRCTRQTTCSRPHSTSPTNLLTSAPGSLCDPHSPPLLPLLLALLRLLRLRLLLPLLLALLHLLLLRLLLMRAVVRQNRSQLSAAQRWRTARWHHSRRTACKVRLHSCVVHSVLRWWQPAAGILILQCLNFRLQGSNLVAASLRVHARPCSDHVVANFFCSFTLQTQLSIFLTPEPRSAYHLCTPKPAFKASAACQHSLNPNNAVCYHFRSERPHSGGCPTPVNLLF